MTLLDVFLVSGTIFFLINSLELAFSVVKLWKEVGEEIDSENKEK